MDIIGNHLDVFLNGHICPDDIEILCAEMNLKKEKWVIIGTYRPPRMNDTYFVDHLSTTLDVYNSKYDRIVIGDFNLEPCTPLMKTLCNGHDLHNLISKRL